MTDDAEYWLYWTRNKKGKPRKRNYYDANQYHAPKAIKSVINPGQKRQACGESPDMSDQNVEHQRIYPPGFGSSKKGKLRS
jgi:hypothetical protein